MKVREEDNIDKQIEKQMGCMAGFFQIFDRHQVLAGKRIYSTRRLPSSPSTSSPSPSETSDASPPPSAKVSSLSPPTPKKTPASTKAEAAAPRPPLPLPVFDFKEGSKTMWKLREAPRLSLDSKLLEQKGKLYPREIRTTPIAVAAQSDGSDMADDHDRQRRSPSVVARLMGLDLLPGNDADGVAADVPIRKSVLRRSASESRASRDLLPFALLPTDSKTPPAKSNAKQNAKTPSARQVPQVTVPVQRKNFFDAQDFFPEPSKRVPVPAANGGMGGGGSLYGEIEKRLRMRGIDEPAKDLETLKQILEALQLKGLLHSGRREDRRNVVYDGRPNSATQSPIVLMKPATAVTRQSTSPTPTKSRLGASPPRRNLISDPRPRKERPAAAERKPQAAEARSPSSLARHRGAAVDRKTSTVQSPRSAAQSPRRAFSESGTARSPRSRKPAPAPAPAQIEISDESSTVSESSYSTNSQFDLERVKIEEYQQGRSLLERCDKLLHSIEEITTSGSPAASVIPSEMNQQPSPVSVLDAAGSLSPSVAWKRCIDLKDHKLEGESVEPWSPSLRPHLLLPSDESEAAGDSDFEYVVEVLRVLVSDRAAASSHDVYLSMEKHYQTPADSDNKASRLHRCLVFDTVVEIIERNKRVSPWESFAASRSQASSESSSAAAREVWAEVRRIKEKVPAEDLCDLVCGVLRKDISSCRNGDERGWGGRAVELSDAVLDIERLIFKDLVAEAIKDLASSASSPLSSSSSLPPVRKCRLGSPAAAPPRRKLVF